MQLKFIDRNTKLFIEILDHDLHLVSEETYPGIFIDHGSGVDFFISCDYLLEHFNENMRRYIKIYFTDHHRTYSFIGKMLAVEVKNHENVIHTTAFSLVEESQKAFRAPRVEHSSPVTVYTIQPGTRSALCEKIANGVSQDISSTGLCILSDSETVLKEGEYYVVEFYFTANKRFFIRSKLMRAGDSVRILSYKHDYGFLFDFEEGDIAGRGNLMLALFEYKLNHT
jgi:hypothetical protein